MKKTTKNLRVSRNLLFWGIILLGFNAPLKADCNFVNINANTMSCTGGLSGCTGILTITGKFTINCDLNIATVAPGITEIRISGAAANIDFTGNRTLTLPPNINLVFSNGGYIDITGSCTDDQRIVIGSRIATCDGTGTGATVSFTQINNADVFSEAGALPISLLSFTGKPTDNAIALKWETASEKDNAYIAVERSKDGINFVELHQEKGFGTTSEPKSYSWTDRTPFSGVNYYRLRQVDYDGKFEYHPIIAVEYNGKVAQPSIRLYPTEVKDRITIQVDTPPTEDATLLVVDLTGRILQRQPMATGIVQHELQLNNLPAGQYFVTVQSAKIVQTARFVKL